MKPLREGVSPGEMLRLLYAHHLGSQLAIDHEYFKEQLLSDIPTLRREADKYLELALSKEGLIQFLAEQFNYGPKADTTRLEELILQYEEAIRKADFSKIGMLCLDVEHEADRIGYENHSRLYTLHTMAESVQEGVDSNR